VFTNTFNLYLNLFCQWYSPIYCVHVLDERNAFLLVFMSLLDSIRFSLLYCRFKFVVLITHFTIVAYRIYQVIYVYFIAVACLFFNVDTWVRHRSRYLRLTYYSLSCRVRPCVLFSSVASLRDLFMILSVSTAHAGRTARRLVDA